MTRMAAIKIHNELFVTRLIYYELGKCKRGQLRAHHESRAYFIRHIFKRNEILNKMQSIFYIFFGVGKLGECLCLRHVHLHEHQAAASVFFFFNEVWGLQGVLVSIGPQSVSRWCVSGVKQQMDTRRGHRGIIPSATASSNQPKALRHREICNK